MKTTSIENNTLYIAIGDLNDFTKLLQKEENLWVPHQSFVSIDEMKERYATPNENADFIDSALEHIVLSKLEEGLTTIYHYGETISDNYILKLISHCKKHGLKYKILSFNKKIGKKYFVQEEINEDTVFIKNVIEIKEDKLDAIGDIHGCYKEMITLIKRMGYNMSTGVPIHPNGRKIVWLGDLVDRGPKSVDVLKFVRTAVEKGGHYCIRGNHEEYLIKSFNSYKKGERIPSGEGMKRTLVEFLREFDEAQREEYISFIQSLPFYLIKTYSNKVKFALTHGNLASFDPFKTSRNNCIFGSDDDLDATYEEKYLAGENEYILIRGHIDQSIQREGVFSLEDRQSFSGNLMSLSLDLFKGDTSIKSFNKKAIKQKVSFNYIKFKKRETLLKRIKREEADGFIKRGTNNTRTLFTITYDKKAEESKFWGREPFHKKIKHIVLDLNGEIVQKSFDEIEEYSASNSLDLESSSQYVDIVPEVKGELYSVSIHPFEKRLLITNGKSNIVLSIPGLKKESEKEIMDILNSGIEGATIMFKSTASAEVYLVGARDNTLNSKLYEEGLLDILAKKIDVHRPTIEYNLQFQDALAKVKNSKEGGYIFRDGSTKKYLARVSA